VTSLHPKILSLFWQDDVQEFHPNTGSNSQTWCYMPIILALKKLRQKDRECEANLSYTVTSKPALSYIARPSPKQNKQKPQGITTTTQRTKQYGKQNGP
jgi:hypothetical protein